ncbi:TRAP transporter large permease [Paracoccus thiocyanatus]|uniref:C4-dicarboxylate ABC transporter permease n=1 Tax=Paracoccus thiocyanatus TaxID=34006 RepID=A0A3D8PH10_9RHOB|nr:TRAP transporter large permease subunit [Paracoccus thiocyanatus]RDW14777.1 C4-dicarboxylate ABC transporter permease [Paracoccus thiocyanatus]
MTGAFPTIALFSGVLVLMGMGVPLAFGAGAAAILMAWTIFGPQSLGLVLKTVYGLTTEYVLISAPMFILLASLLERSNIARDLYDSLAALFGGIRGGVAYVTLFLSVILATVSGTIGGEIVLLGLVALPQMMRLNYNRKISIGIVCAGGSLGTMLPPSLVLIFYGLTADVSVQKLFTASVLPSVVLSLMYLGYLFVCFRLRPDMAPNVLRNRPRLDARQILRGVVPVLILMMAIFGCIYGGITSITEAATIGVAIALVITSARGELNVRMLREALVQTFRACGIVLWVTFGAAILISVYNLSGGQRLVTGWITGADLSPLATILFMMAILMILGLFMDWIGICLLCMPIFVPIVTGLGYDPIWFGILFSVSMQVAFLSPPFGPAAFFLKSVAPPEITLPLIFRSMGPFIAIQIVLLGLLIAFPQLALWLPGL